MNESIQNLTFSLKHVHISYTERKANIEDESMRFMEDDIIGLINSHNERVGEENSNLSKDISIILINSISWDKGYEENINNVVEIFINQNSDEIIAYAATPTVESIPDSNEVFIPITRVPGIQDNTYAISNYGRVLMMSTENQIPIKYFEDGPRVGIVCEDQNIRFYSVSYLMTRIFNSDLPTDDWTKEFDRICKQCEDLGFVSINDYCTLEYTEAFVYPNNPGSIIIDEANILTKNKRKCED